MSEAEKSRSAVDPAGHDALLRALRPSVESMLALAKLLADNEENSLSAKQIDYAQTIYSAGTHLLGVLDGILTGAQAPAVPASTAEAVPILGPSPVAIRLEAGGRPYRGRRSRRPDDGVVLIAERDAVFAAALIEQVRAAGYGATAAAKLGALRKLLDERRPDALIVGTLDDAGTQDVLDLIETRPGSRRQPAVMALDRDEGIEGALARTVRFLHGVIGTPQPTRRRMLMRRRRGALDLVGKKILVVDGDVRHIYAVTCALEQQGMLVVHAESGAEGMAVLENHPDTEAVLMDTLLPEPDGYGTIRLMRRMPQFGSLPIIALTARARLEDREECIAAGASDYLTKPVKDEQLVSLLRAWLLTPR